MFVPIILVKKVKPVLRRVELPASVTVSLMTLEYVVSVFEDKLSLEFNQFLFVLVVDIGELSCPSDEGNSTYIQTSNILI